MTVNNNVDMNQMLAQMRVLANAAQSGAVEQNPVAGQPPVEGGEKPDFGKMLADSIQSVSDAQMEGGAMKKAFDAGDPDLELPEVMVALQKASLSFQAMTQVRNKLLSAYQEVMNMQV
ncbi:flagellar hook-basal body complex protein FliE [Porticoccus sp. W117]|uniref:flagellar hook-basal body complex protein FliE n=1 Tax=Porticoccus sp. W117 TaxID=3054777 RepID=UPI0025990342|nr:flagellar hook-basal body complex protein FliE [Porticoccus sp. W117]MDM3871006.1 flagellar hook-basal body complex protein FliE [Porticoccus sp. W117]